MSDDQWLFILNKEELRNLDIACTLAYTHYMEKDTIEEKSEAKSFLELKKRIRGVLDA